MDSDLNKLDILIVSALEVETQDQLNDYEVIYTGVGKVNATYELTSYFAKCELYDGDYPKLVVNYGTAGSRKFKKKPLVDCTKFIQRDIPIILDSTHIKFNPIGKNATCGSGDNFVEDRTNYYGEVVDMEAYALAKVCHIHNVPFISFKYITDGADEQANEDWEANLASGIVEFKKKVLDLLPNI